jgi:hypothetical protein
MILIERPRGLQELHRRFNVQHWKKKVNDDFTRKLIHLREKRREINLFFMTDGFVFFLYIEEIKQYLAVYHPSSFLQYRRHCDLILKFENTDVIIKLLDGLMRRWVRQLTTSHKELIIVFYESHTSFIETISIRFMDRHFHP